VPAVASSSSAYLGPILPFLQDLSDYVGAVNPTELFPLDLGDSLVDEVNYVRD